MKSYFTLEELYRSTTATAMGIDNTPTPQIKENLLRMINFLNPLREAWGSPIRITSGYRCEKLNDAIGGSKTSAHKTGNAVDMQPMNKKMEEFKQFVTEYLKNGKFWDQCLKEKSASAEWIHLGLYSNTGLQRKQIKNLYV